ncbi:MAG: stalk domain-containing protein [Bacillota bacterium]|nr:stalk domain-containing protein [Bacillota bacterium]
MNIRKILTLIIVFMIISSLTYNYTEASSIINDTQQLKNYIIDSLYNRESVITVNYKGSSSDLEKTLNSILNSDPYINYSINSWQWSYEGYENNINITIKINHLLTKNQEEEIHKKINYVLSDIIDPEMTSHEKIKEIHDYIVLNTEYDTSYTNYTHYDALFDNKSVCNGYALLGYKMLKTAGFDVGFVEGTANGENHLWNIISISGYKYHIDMTWNDPVPNLDYPVYNYYMLTDKEISKDHQYKGNLSTTTPYHRLLNIDISSKVNRNTELINLMKEIELYDYYDPIDIILDGKNISFDQPPIIQNGRTLVPFRAIYENFGMEVDWISEERTAVGYNDKLNISMQINSDRAFINNMEFILEAPPIIINNRTLVPVRFISESLGKEVSWDNMNRNVIIK